MALIDLRNALMAGKKSPSPQMTFTIIGTSFVSNASSLGLTTSDGSPVVVDWGDGTKTTSASGSSLGNHTYPSNGTWTARVFSDGVLTKVENYCFYRNAQMVSIEIPNTVTYIGNNGLRETGITEFTFQRQFTYGSWPVYGCNSLQRMKFDGKFVPVTLASSLFPVLSVVEFGADVNDNDIYSVNGSMMKVSGAEKCTSVTVSPDNQYYEVRGQSINVPQIVRKSDNCLIFAAFGLIGDRGWDGSGVDASVRAFTHGLTQSLTCAKFTVREGVENVGYRFCRDCPNLTEVDLPSTLSTFGSWPLYNSPNITKITCRAQVPPSPLGSYGSYNTNAVVHVPAGCLAAYRAARFWSAFTTIVDDVQ